MVEKNLEDAMIEYVNEKGTADLAYHLAGVLLSLMAPTENKAILSFEGAQVICTRVKKNEEE